MNDAWHDGHAIWCSTLTCCECGAKRPLRASHAQIDGAVRRALAPLVSLLRPRRFVGQSSRMTLTADEKTILNGFANISETDYLAQKRKNAGTSTAVASRANGLSENELAVCQTLGLSPETYAVAKAARLSGGSPVSAAFSSAIDGRQIVEEAAAEHHEQLDDDNATAEDLARDAAEAIANFLADPQGEDRWRHLARASAFTRAAVERSAPAHVDREPYGEVEAERRRKEGRAA